MQIPIQNYHRNVNIINNYRRNANINIRLSQKYLGRGTQSPPGSPCGCTAVYSGSDEHRLVHRGLCHTSGSTSLTWVEPRWRYVTSSRIPSHTYVAAYVIITEKTYFIYDYHRKGSSPYVIIIELHTCASLHLHPMRIHPKHSLGVNMM